jgi:hypothetical protein
MSAYISQTDLDELERRIAPLPPKRLGQALFQQRTQAGARQARVPGFDETEVGEFETGRRRPDAATVGALLSIYGCGLDDLVPPRLPLIATGLSGRSDKEVLARYLEAVRGWRNSGSRQVQLRQDDLAVLVTILGSDPDEIVSRMIELTGCNWKTANRFQRIFRGGVAAAAIGTLGLGGLAVAGRSDAATTRASADVILSAPATRAGPADGTPVVSSAKSASTDYAFWGRAPSGAPYRWNPSQTVTVAYFARPGAPPIDIAGAIASLAQATGLSMKLVGAGPADITVSFVPNLNGGLAGSTSEERDTNGFIDKADVVLSEQTPKTLLHEALLHELGHAVGLGHAPRPGEVMDPQLTGQTGYQAGDLAGLRALGPHGDPSYIPPG